MGWHLAGAGPNHCVKCLVIFGNKVFCCMRAMLCMVCGMVLEYRWLEPSYGVVPHSMMFVIWVSLQMDFPLSPIALCQLIPLWVQCGEVVCDSLLMACSFAALLQPLAQHALPVWSASHWPTVVGSH